MKTKRSHEGYLLIDHKASPGTAQIREGAVFESATVTCSHCHALVVLNPDRSRSRGYCPKCDQYVCDACEVRRVASGFVCHALSKRLDRLQEDAFRNLKRTPGGIVLP